MFPQDGGNVVGAKRARTAPGPGAGGGGSYGGAPGEGLGGELAGRWRLWRACTAQGPGARGAAVADLMARQVSGTVRNL